jgi:hypothetical protein
MNHLVRVYLCGASVLAAMVWATGASADRPIKEHGETETTFSVPANTLCSFPLTIQAESRGFTITHLDKDGKSHLDGCGGKHVRAGDQ